MNKFSVLGSSPGMLFVHVSIKIYYLAQNLICTHGQLYKEQWTSLSAIRRHFDIYL